MKIVTIGQSPYLLTSRAKLNADILKCLYENKHRVASFVKGHDKNYFVPEEEGKHFYYSFILNNQKHKIPIIPIDIGKDETVLIYELIKRFKPDIVITIGDYNEFPFMKAIKQIYDTDLKWFFILTNFSNPINENLTDLIQSANGVLCTSLFGRQTIEDFYHDNLDYQWVGVELKDIPIKTKNSFRIMACAKKNSSDNLPMLMETAAKIKMDLPQLQLYIHSNINDPKDHDIELLKERFDPKDIFIKLPDKYVSIVEGIKNEDLYIEYLKSDIFVSIPVNAATSMTVLEALSYGCYPIMSKCGSNIEIAKELSLFLGNELKEDDFLVRTIKVMVPGESYIGIPDPDDLQKKIENAYWKIKKNKGLSSRFFEFSKKYDNRFFMDKMTVMIDRVFNSLPVVCLDK